MTITISEAVGSLEPTTNFAVRDDKILAWDIAEPPTNKPQPTEAEIQAEIIRLEKEYSDNEYARNRASAFPSIGDQMDMQYWDSVNGTTTWKDAIAKVKSDNPKA